MHHEGLYLAILIQIYESVNPKQKTKNKEDIHNSNQNHWRCGAGLVNRQTEDILSKKEEIESGRYERLVLAFDP